MQIGIIILNIQFKIQAQIYKFSAVVIIIIIIIIMKNQCPEKQNHSRLNYRVKNETKTNKKKIGINKYFVL